VADGCFAAVRAVPRIRGSAILARIRYWLKVMPVGRVS